MGSQAPSVDPLNSPFRSEIGQHEVRTERGNNRWRALLKQFYPPRVWTIASISRIVATEAKKMSASSHNRSQLARLTQTQTSCFFRLHQGLGRG